MGARINLGSIDFLRKPYRQVPLNGTKTFACIESGCALNSSCHGGQQMASDVEGPSSHPGPPLWTQLGPCDCNVSGGPPSSTLHEPSKGRVEGESILTHEVAQVLHLWLEWNKNYEKLTESMYRQARDFHSLQLMADELDRLRLRAIAATEHLLTRIREKTTSKPG
jgi:hypothetical protein